MGKRQSSLHEKLLNDAKKTHPNSLLMQEDDIVRILHPKEFPTNKPRLYNKLVKNCQIGIRDLIFLLNKLPTSYKYKVLVDYNFDPFIQTLLVSSLVIDKKEKKRKTKSHSDDQDKKQFELPSFTLSTIMFNRAAEGIINTMPVELRDSLKRQIYPFMSMVNSISNLVNSSMKTKLPYVPIPHELVPPEYPEGKLADLSF